MRRVQKKLHEIHSFSWKWQREKRRDQSDLFRQYKGDNYGSLLTQWLGGLFSWLCWQNYLDSQRFYFHLLVLIGQARFNKSFSQRSVSLSDCSNVCLPSGRWKMSVSDWQKKSVSLSLHCFGLTAYIELGGEKDNF